MVRIAWLRRLELKQNYPISTSPYLAGVKKFYVRGENVVENALRRAQRDYAEDKGKR